MAASRSRLGAAGRERRRASRSTVEPLRPCCPAQVRAGPRHHPGPHHAPLRSTDIDHDRRRRCPLLLLPHDRARSGRRDRAQRGAWSGRGRPSARDRTPTRSSTSSRRRGLWSWASEDPDEPARDAHPTETLAAIATANGYRSLGWKDGGAIRPGLSGRLHQHRAGLGSAGRNRHLPMSLADGGDLRRLQHRRSQPRRRWPAGGGRRRPRLGRCGPASSTPPSPRWWRRDAGDRQHRRAGHQRARARGGTARDRRERFDGDRRGHRGRGRSGRATVGGRAHGRRRQVRSTGVRGLPHAPGLRKATGRRSSRGGWLARPYDGGAVSG